MNMIRPLLLRRAGSAAARCHKPRLFTAERRLLATLSAAGEPQQRVMYPTHVPTSPTQKVLLSVISAFTVFSDPERGDMLATLGEVTGA